MTTAPTLSLSHGTTWVVYVRDPGDLQPAGAWCSDLERRLGQGGRS